MIRWPSFRAVSLSSTLERAEGGLPAVEAVVQAADAFGVGPGLEGAADVVHAVHAGGVPGDGELVEGLLGVGACGFGVLLGDFDGGQVAEDDGALFGVGVADGLQDAEECGLGLGGLPGLELGVALE